MPTFYLVRKSTRGQWTQDDLTRAVNAVLQEQIPIRQAARTNNIPERTLRARLATQKFIKGSSMGESSFLGEDAERKLCNHVQKLQASGFAPTTKNLRMMAYNLAKSMGLRHRFNEDKKMAGADWLKLFLKRNPTLSIRKAEGVSLSRAEGMNKEEVNKYFELFTKVLTENELLNKPLNGHALEETVAYRNRTERTAKTKSVTAFYFDSTKQERSSQADVWDLMMEFKSLAADLQGKEFLLAVPPGQKAETMRKMVEAIFLQTDYRFIIKAQKQQKSDKKEKNAQGRGEAILIELGEITYADTLRKIKCSSIDTETREDIKKVKKTAKGDLLLTVAAGSGMNLRNKLKDVIQGQRIRSLGGEKVKTLFIKDLDGIADVEELQAALQQTGAIQAKEKIQIKNVRVTPDGSQTATVVLEEGDANRIIEKQKLRVGLTECRIQERLDVSRWLQVLGLRAHDSRLQRRRPFWGLP